MMKRMVLVEGTVGKKADSPAARRSTPSVYDLMTLDSALAYYRGRGAYWKGRAQAPR